MFLQRNTIRSLMVFGLTSFASLTSSTPTAPNNGIEIFNPTYRVHKIDAICGGTTAVIEWTYNGDKAILKKFTLSKFKASKSEIESVNNWISDLDGDIFTWIECNNSGAVLYFIQAQFAGTQKAKQIRLNFVDGRFSLIRKYNF